MLKEFELVLLLVYSAHAIPLDQFYPFGISSGDRALYTRQFYAPAPRIFLSTRFPFFQKNHSSLVVNKNGLIFFERTRTNLITPGIPRLFPVTDRGRTNNQVIAPYWAHTDITNSGYGNLWYRESVEQSDFDKAQADIRHAYPEEAANFRPRLVFIATWHVVGYWYSGSDKVNTFQCVLATDGFVSYVIFLYADGFIQWTTGDYSGGINGLGGDPAVVGYDAGDGINFFNHEDSQTDAIINITRKTFPEGHDRAGVLIFRVDGRGKACTVNATDAELVLAPRIGNQLGGTPVLVRGFCLRPYDVITCLFDGIAGLASYVNPSTALCVTPTMPSAGQVAMEMRILNRTTHPITLSATFINVSPVRAHQVGFISESSDDSLQLYLKSEITVKISWSPLEVVPISLNLGNTKINIELYQQIQKFRGSKKVTDWVPIDDTKMSDVTNNGSVEMTIPKGLVMKNCPDQNKLCPVAFKVSIDGGTLVNVSSGEQLVRLPRGHTAGIWSGIAFLQADRANTASLSQICEDWFNNDNNKIPTSILLRLLTCPPTSAQATVDSRFRREDFGRQATGYDRAAMRFYHPDDERVTCFLQIVMSDGENSKESLQCCYGEDGNLITGQTGGGSADKVSPMINYNLHLINDLLPYSFCCRGGNKCAQYYMLRPSMVEGAPEYVLPVPAIIVGDPHIVTLDGHKYTYNGEGDFILIETHDNTFTLQGRMEWAMTSDGNLVRGTVLTGLVAWQSRSVNTTVEFQVGRQGVLEVLVNKELVDFIDSMEQDFQQVVIVNKGNDTILAEFSGGSNLEIRIENKIISVMQITLPNHYRSLTKGLMGNYNSKPDDDLVPRNGFTSISVNSSAEEIFSFGNTWKVNEASESLFSSNRPFSGGSFRPTFEPTFFDPELEIRATEICGDDKFCLFDIAVTKNEDVGIATMQGMREFDIVVDLAEPILCTPPCSNGTCVATNTCSCSMGYSGERCTNILLSECDEDMCQNNGTCVQHVKSFTCDCPDGYIGIFCQEKEPPFSIRLINSSPRMEGDDVISVEFISLKPLKSANCSLLNVSDKDCSISRVKFTGLQPGSYILVITAESVDGESYVERRDVTVCDVGRSLGVHLINEGITVSGRCAHVQFRGCGEIDHFRCKLDGGSYEQCLSPVRHCELELGSHEFQILPVGDPEDQPKSFRLSANFKII